MKMFMTLALFIIIGCTLSAGCATQNNSVVEKSTSPTITPSIHETTYTGTQQIVPVGSGASNEDMKGLLNISIGDYSAWLPVFIDNISAGEVSRGKPLNLKVYEGIHTVKVCSGNECEQVNVEIKSTIKTIIDFGDWLKKTAPQGPLTVSIGEYNARVLVYLDNASVGAVSQGKPLQLMVSQGTHTVKVCSGSLCEQQNVEINITKQNSVDFGERLKQALPMGPLSVSISGYNAELPVFIDNTTVGIVSTGKPLNLMVSEGRHTVKVCVGLICESEDVDIKFAQPFYVDFGERLKKEVEFPSPTIRIVNSFLSGSSLTVDVEFINPDMIDHTMTATIGCGYSYIDPTSKERKNSYVQSLVTKSVKSGNRVNQGITLYLPGGSAVIANKPKVDDMIVT